VTGGIPNEAPIGAMKSGNNGEFSAGFTQTLLDRWEHLDHHTRQAGLPSSHSRRVGVYGGHLGLNSNSKQ